MKVKKVFNYLLSQSRMFVKHATSDIILMPHLQVGHAGTLDPMATGLLIVCVGKATKVVDRYG